MNLGGALVDSGGLKAVRDDPDLKQYYEIDVVNHDVQDWKDVLLIRKIADYTPHGQGKVVQQCRCHEYLVFLRCPRRFVDVEASRRPPASKARG